MAAKTPMTWVAEWLRVKSRSTDATTPAAGYGAFYAKSKSPYFVNEDGTVFGLAAGAGDVVGPGSAVNGHLAVFSGTTGKLIADGGAVIPGFVQISKVTRTAGDLTTTSTSLVDVTSLSVTMTTGARRCMIIFSGNAKNSTAGSSTIFDVDIDGAAQGGSYGLSVMSQATSAAYPVGFTYFTDVLSAASHTFKIRWRVDANTGTLFASSGVAPAILTVVETGLTA